MFKVSFFLENISAVIFLSIHSLCGLFSEI